MVDVKKLEYYLNSPLMKRIVELKERNFADKDQFEDAPVNYDDAIENYKRILAITDDVAKTIIEPNSESVDQEGPHLENNRMVYASKTYENLDATRKAGLWGISMPRCFGGLNLPITVFSMLSEMVSAADSGFQNVWSLQSCIDSLVHPSSRLSIYPVSAKARPCPWTLPSPTPALTCSVSCLRLHRTLTAHGDSTV